jgi:hypothetical protein
VRSASLGEKHVEVIIHPICCRIKNHAAKFVLRLPTIMPNCSREMSYKKEDKTLFILNINNIITISTPPSKPGTPPAIPKT